MNSLPANQVEATHIPVYAELNSFLKSHSPIYETLNNTNTAKVKSKKKIKKKGQCAADEKDQFEIKKVNNAKVSAMHSKLNQRINGSSKVDSTDNDYNNLAMPPSTVKEIKSNKAKNDPMLSEFKQQIGYKPKLNSLLKSHSPIYETLNNTNTAKVKSKKKIKKKGQCAADKEGHFEIKKVNNAKVSAMFTKLNQRISESSKVDSTDNDYINLVRPPSTVKEIKAIRDKNNNPVLSELKQRIGNKPKKVQSTNLAGSLNQKNKPIYQNFPAFQQRRPLKSTTEKSRIILHKDDDKHPGGNDRCYGSERSSSSDGNSSSESYDNDTSDSSDGEEGEGEFGESSSEYYSESSDSENIASAATTGVVDQNPIGKFVADADDVGKLAFKGSAPSSTASSDTDSDSEGIADGGDNAGVVALAKNNIIKSTVNSQQQAITKFEVGYEPPPPLPPVAKANSTNKKIPGNNNLLNENDSLLVKYLTAQEQTVSQHMESKQKNSQQSCGGDDGSHQKKLFVAAIKPSKQNGAKSFGEAPKSDNLPSAGRNLQSLHFKKQPQDFMDTLKQNDVESIGDPVGKSSPPKHPPAGSDETNTTIGVTSPEIVSSAPELAPSKHIKSLIPNIPNIIQEPKSAIPTAVIATAKNKDADAVVAGGGKAVAVGQQHHRKESAANDKVAASDHREVLNRHQIESAPLNNNNQMAANFNHFILPREKEWEIGNHVSNGNPTSTTVAAVDTKNLENPTNPPSVSDENIINNHINKEFIRIRQNLKSPTPCELQPLVPTELVPVTMQPSLTQPQQPSIRPLHYRTPNQRFQRSGADETQPILWPTTTPGGFNPRPQFTNSHHHQQQHRMLLQTSTTVAAVDTKNLENPTNPASVSDENIINNHINKEFIRIRQNLKSPTPCELQPLVPTELVPVTMQPSLTQPQQPSIRPLHYRTSNQRFQRSGADETQPILWPTTTPGGFNPRPQFANSHHHQQQHRVLLQTVPVAIGRPLVNQNGITGPPRMVRPQQHQNQQQQQQQQQRNAIRLYRVPRPQHPRAFRPHRPPFLHRGPLVSRKTGPHNPSHHQMQATGMVKIRPQHHPISTSGDRQTVIVGVPFNHLKEKPSNHHMDNANDGQKMEKIQNSRPPPATLNKDVKGDTNRPLHLLPQTNTTVSDVKQPSKLATGNSKTSITPVVLQQSSDNNTKKKSIDATTQPKTTVLKDHARFEQLAQNRAVVDDFVQPRYLSSQFESSLGSRESSNGGNDKDDEYEYYEVYDYDSTGVVDDVDVVDDIPPPATMLVPTAAVTESFLSLTINKNSSAQDLAVNRNSAIQRGPESSVVAVDDDYEHVYENEFDSTQLQPSIQPPAMLKINLSGHIKNDDQRSSIVQNPFLKVDKNSIDRTKVTHGVITKNKMQSVTSHKKSAPVKTSPVVLHAPKKNLQQQSRALLQSKGHVQHAHKLNSEQHINHPQMMLPSNNVDDSIYEELGAADNKKLNQPVSTTNTVHRNPSKDVQTKSDRNNNNQPRAPPAKSSPLLVTNFNKGNSRDTKANERMTIVKDHFLETTKNDKLGKPFATPRENIMRHTSSHQIQTNLRPLSPTSSRTEVSQSAAVNKNQRRGGNTRKPCLSTDKNKTRNNNKLPYKPNTSINNSVNNKHLLEPKTSVIIDVNDTVDNVYHKNTIFPKPPCSSRDEQKVYRQQQHSRSLKKSSVIIDVIDDNGDSNTTLPPFSSEDDDDDVNEEEEESSDEGTIVFVGGSASSYGTLIPTFGSSTKKSSKNSPQNLTEGHNCSLQQQSILLSCITGKPLTIEEKVGMMQNQKISGVGSGFREPAFRQNRSQKTYNGCLATNSSTRTSAATHCASVDVSSLEDQQNQLLRPRRKLDSTTSSTTNAIAKSSGGQQPSNSTAGRISKRSPFPSGLETATPEMVDHNNSQSPKLSNDQTSSHSGAVATSHSPQNRQSDFFATTKTNTPPHLSRDWLLTDHAAVATSTRSRYFESTMASLTSQSPTATANQQVNTTKILFSMSYHTVSRPPQSQI